MEQENMNAPSHPIFFFFFFLRGLESPARAVRKTVGHLGHPGDRVAGTDSSNTLEACRA